MDIQPGAPAPGVVATLSANTIQSLAEELRRIVQQELRDAGLGAAKKVELATRWGGGELVLRPGREDLQEKAVPIEQFFRKIVNMREQLRNLEREINNHPKLDDGDKLELQQYLTRVYGSFTTFNVLFADKGDHFVGQKTGR